MGRAMRLQKILFCGIFAERSKPLAILPFGFVEKTY